MLRQRSPTQKERGDEIEFFPSINIKHGTTKKRVKKGRCSTKARFRLIFFAQSVIAIGLLLRVLYHRTASKGGRGHRRQHRTASGPRESQSPPPPHYPSVLLLPPLEAGEVAPLAWAEDGAALQEYGARVGLPPRLVPTLTEYAARLGLLDVMVDKPYDSPIEPGESERYSFRSPYQEAGADRQRRAFTWEAMKPEGEKWHSDSMWFNTADELAHEDALRALAKGGFDDVLKGLGEYFELSELHVDSFGFSSMTKNDGEYWHSDFSHVEGGGFGLLFEIVSAGEPGQDHGTDLYVEGDNGLRGEIEYSQHAGLVIGDETYHATSICDHRAHRGTRVTAVIYLNELTESNIRFLSGDTNSRWPPLNIQADWMWAQRGRHWRGDGTGPGLLHDRGRAPLEANDGTSCSRRDCNEEERRDECLITCALILEDDYYRPGMPRQKLLGY